MKNSYFIVCLILFLMFSTSASSNNIDNEWNYSLTPYAWLAGFEGEAGKFEDLPPIFVDISPKEAFQDSDSSFALIFEAKKGKHGIYIDYFYSNSLSDEVIFPELAISSRSRTKNTMNTLAYERVFIKKNKASLSLLAGAR